MSKPIRQPVKLNLLAIAIVLGAAILVAICAMMWR